MGAGNTARPVSAMRLVIHFFGVWFGGMVLFGLLAFMAAGHGIELRNDAAGLILVFIASLTSGHLWYRRENAVPAPGRMLRAALLCMLFLAIFHAAVIVAIPARIPQFPAFGRLSQSGREMLWVVLAGAALFLVPVARIGLGRGIRQGCKAAEKVAERAARKVARQG